MTHLGTLDPSQSPPASPRSLALQQQVGTFDSILHSGPQDSLSPKSMQKVEYSDTHLVYVSGSTNSTMTMQQQQRMLQPPSILANLEQKIVCERQLRQEGVQLLADKM